MTEDERRAKGLTRLLDRIGDALLGMKAELSEMKRIDVEAHRDILAQNNTIIQQNAGLLGEVKTLNRGIDALERLLDGLDRDVNDVRRDLTPVRGVPLPVKPEKSNGEKVKIGPAEIPVKTLARVGKNLPWIALGVFLALAVFTTLAIVIFRVSPPPAAAASDSTKP